MNLFQKVLLISALIPYYSCIIVNLVTYVVCWKKKLSFAPFVICFFAYGILMFLVINCNVLPLIKYIASCFVALVGNYCLISLQMRDWQIPICLTDSHRMKASLWRGRWQKSLIFDGGRETRRENSLPQSFATQNPAPSSEGAVGVQITAYAVVRQDTRVKEYSMSL